MNATQPLGNFIDLVMVNTLRYAAEDVVISTAEDLVNIQQLQWKHLAICIGPFETSCCALLIKLFNEIKGIISFL